jgi:hypothetical protein
MTVLHGAVTGVEVDALRLPLKKKMTALADLPAHIVAFRGHLARLTTAGQAPLALDAYRLFLASLSPFPIFHQYTLLWTVANGAMAQQTFEAYAAYILGQHANILAHFNLRPFVGNLEGYEDGASEDDGMGEDPIYPNPPPPAYPNTLLPMPCNPITLPTNPTLLNNFYHPPLALGSTLTPTPWPMVFFHTLPRLLPLLLPLTIIMCDNTCAIDMRFHLVRDRVRQGQFIISYIKSADNIADYFTKNLDPLKHKFFMQFLAPNDTQL